MIEALLLIEQELGLYCLRDFPVRNLELENAIQKDERFQKLRNLTSKYLESLQCSETKAAAVPVKKLSLSGF